MSMTDVFQQIVLPILTTAAVAVAGFLGGLLRKAYDKLSGTDEKRKIVETCVAAVEQLYHDLSGDEKKEKAIDAIRDMAAVKGIEIAQIEIEIMIEAAVAKFNDAFNRPKDTENEGGTPPEEADQTAT